MFQCKFVVNPKAISFSVLEDGESICASLVPIDSVVFIKYDLGMLTVECGHSAFKTRYVTGNAATQLVDAFDRLIHDWNSFQRVEIAYEYDEE